MTAPRRTASPHAKAVERIVHRAYPRTFSDAKSRAVLRRAILRLVARVEREARGEAFSEAIVIANGACRAGEKCQDGGGCDHVPCITARMIVDNIRRRHAAQKGARRK